jgi:hypothetical protein
MLKPFEQEGGSWEVRVSLAGVGQWLRDLGQFQPSEVFKGMSLRPRTNPMDQEIQYLSEEWSIRYRSGDGHEPRDQRTLSALRPPVQLEGVAYRSREVPGSLNRDPAAWI